MNVFAFWLMNFEMNEWIENKTDLLILKNFFNILVTMTLVSYMSASFRKPKAIPQLSNDQNAAN
jgi:hypothetical protein